MVEQDYIDITPESGGARGIKSTVFQETEWDIIVNNPGSLTKEGVQKKIELWKHSSNAHCRIMYETMAKRCKLVAPSGTTENGEIIYSRDKQGIPNWIEGKEILQPKEAKPILSLIKKK